MFFMVVLVVLVVLKDIQEAQDTSVFGQVQRYKYLKKIN